METKLEQKLHLVDSCMPEEPGYDAMPKYDLCVVYMSDVSSKHTYNCVYVNYFAYKQVLSHNTESAYSQYILIVYVMYLLCIAKLKT